MRNYYELKFTTGNYLYIETDYDLQDLQRCIENKSIIKVDILLSSHTSKESLINAGHIMYAIKKDGNPHTLCD